MIIKKILEIFLIFLLISTYCNIGYWSGKSYYQANQALEKGEKLNILQKFQLGPRFVLKQKSKEDGKSAWEASVIFWPLFLATAIVCWGPYLIFHFVFLGGFFKLIGKIFSLLC